MEGQEVRICRICQEPFVCKTKGKRLYCYKLSCHRENNRILAIYRQRSDWAVERKRKSLLTSSYFDSLITNACHFKHGEKIYDNYVKNLRKIALLESGFRFSYEDEVRENE